MSTVREHERRPSSKHVAQRQHVMQTVELIRRENEVAAAMKKLNQFRDESGWKRRTANNVAFEPGVSEGLL